MEDYIEHKSDTVLSRNLRTLNKYKDNPLKSNFYRVKLLNNPHAETLIQAYQLLLQELGLA